DAVAERRSDAHRMVLASEAIAVVSLYESVEAPADTPISEIPNPKVDPDGFENGLEKLKDGLRSARGDSHWLDIDGTVAAILNRSNVISESRRMYLNQVNASEDSWIAPYEWDAVQSDVSLKPKDRITLAFDGSKSGDWAALVA